MEFHLKATMGEVIGMGVSDETEADDSCSSVGT